MSKHFIMYALLISTYTFISTSDPYNHQPGQQVDSDNQQLALEMQREESESQEAARWITYYENQITLALAKAELRKIKADYAFRQCLVSHIHSSDLGSSGIPNVCENLANRLRILGGGSTVKELTEIFKK